MREYGGDLYFVCIEAQTLAKKIIQFQNLLHYPIRPYTLFINNSIPSRYLFVMIKHVFRRFNHNYVPYRRVKKTDI